MTFYSDTLRDEDQRPIAGAKVYVYDDVTGQLATLTDNLSAPLANPITSDEFGNISFNTADGQKRLDIYLGANRIWEQVIAVGGVPTTFANNAMAIGLFANAATLTIPAGTDRVQTSGYAAIGRGAAEYLYDAAVDAAYVTANPRVSFRSANGRGFRLDPSRGISINHTGAVPDCTAVGVGTDNAAAINAAISYAALSGKGAEILIPRNNLGYRVGSGFNNLWTGGVKVRGQGFSQSPIATYPTAPQHIKGSMLVFDANVAGPKFIAYTDNAANNQVVEFESSIFSVIEDVMLYGGGGTTVTAHGLEVRACLLARNVWVQGFAGEGMRIEASTAGTGLYGNANRSKFDRCFFTGNGCHGAHLKGTDANAIRFDCCEFQTNGGLGVLDETGIGGNSYDDCVFELNNQSYGAVSNQRTQVLVDFAGLSDQAFGSIAFTSTNVPHSCRHCYNETGGWGMKAHLPLGVNVHGGLLAQPESWDATSSPNGINSSNGTHYVAAMKAPGSATTLTCSPQIVWDVDLGWGGVAADARINWSANGGLMMGGNGAAQDFTLFNASALSAMYVNHNSRNVNFQADVLAVGNIKSTGGAIGYTNGVGAGGTVTQPTSKATGVILNKVSGDITMNNAALAAGAIVSFVLTDSFIEATDTLDLNHISGGTPGAYSLNARCGSGVATIDVRNNTGGSLSEAIVIRFGLNKRANS